MKRLIASTACAVMSLGLLAAPAATAAGTAKARPAPSISFSFVHKHVDAGTTLHVRYAAHHAPSGTRLLLQLRDGDKHVWRTVKALKGKSGTASAPAQEIGRYKYQVALVKGKAIVAASPHRYLYSYDSIPYARMCNIYKGDACQHGTIEVGGRLFVYKDAHKSSTYPDYTAVLKYSDTSCRRLNVDFATTDDGGGSNNYVRVVQTQTDPQVGQGTDVGEINHLHATLDGGPFYVEISEDLGGYRMYLNGAANCYTKTGLLPD